MSARAGFTLVEVLVALVVGALVALLAGATLRAGLDADDRVARAVGRDSAEPVVRALLADALRHAVDAPADPRLPAVRLDRVGDSDRLQWPTRGLGAQPGAAALYDATLTADADGLRLQAAPREGGPVLVATLPGVTRLRVQAQPVGEPDRWRTAWSQGTLPRAVRLGFEGAAGREPPAAMVVALGLEGTP